MKHLAIVAVSLLGACTVGPEFLSYQEFKAQAQVEEETGYYIVNGDEVIFDEQSMHDVYELYLDSAYQAHEDGYATIESNLIVNRVSGKDDRWSQATASNLTYCIDRTSFGSRYNAMVSAMSSAAGAWEATANVNYVHASQYDSSCSRSTPVVFNIRMVRTARYLARAFFPSSSRRGREILVSSSSFTNISPWTLTGVMRHELGHTIGFRHEHTRPDSGTCFEDNNWRALTAYDSDSVMHYPQCNGTNEGDLVLTSFDKAGAKALYP